MQFPKYIIGNRTPNIYQKCKVTGLSLEHEKQDAKYIRTSTLKWLHNNEPKTYQLLKSEYLKLNIKKPKFETAEIGHIAKQIRNRYYNPNKIKQTGYKLAKTENQIKLFDITFNIGKEVFS